MTKLARQFADRATVQFKDGVRTAITVRDGVLEYLGAEIGLEPADKVFTVYRSPATIANVAHKLAGIVLTDGHVSLDSPPPQEGLGRLAETDMIDVIDATTHTTIASRSRISMAEGQGDAVAREDRELSLGYHGDLIEHPEYDFEQVGLIPHHMAVVPHGRCGALCSFIDRKRDEGDAMKTKQTKAAEALTAFHDADGEMNMQRVMEIATALPEALKTLPLDQLAKLLPALEEAVGTARGTADEEPTEGEGTDENMEGADEEGENMEGADDDYKDEKHKDADRPPAFTDADVRRFADEQIQKHATVVDKARKFMDEQYSFVGKGTEQIMRDVLKAEGQDGFTDEELPVAFRLLKKTTTYQSFGDSAAAPADSEWDKLADEDLR